MKHHTLKRLGLAITAALGIAGLAVLPASALATPAGVEAERASSASTNDSKQLQLIITKGNSEITRRLTTLNKLSSKINGTAKLSTSDKNMLSSEVSSEVNGLNSLKTTLDAETTAAAAKTDAQSIISGYRVYALVVPKVYLVKTADDQQVAEGRLNSLATKIQADLTADETAGKDVSGLQRTLTDMTGKIQAAQSTSGNVESSVIALQPSDYNSDHTLLSGDRDQLKMAQGELAGATGDAKGLIDNLKIL